MRHLILALLLISLSRSEELFKKVVTEPSAICNDGSPAVYYVQFRRTRKKWMLFFEGGGGCKNTEQCDRRYAEQGYFMSSREYPDEIHGESLFSDSEFEDYNKVLLTYCSSDSWFGDDTNFNDIKVVEDLEERNGQDYPPQVVGSLKDNTTIKNENKTLTSSYISISKKMQMQPTSSLLFTKMHSSPLTNSLVNHMVNKTSSKLIAPSSQKISSSGVLKASNIIPSRTVIAPASSNIPVPKNSTRRPLLDTSQIQSNYKFRGSVIFRSIFKELTTDYALNQSTHILLAGSSAGGVAAVNYANYVRRSLNNRTAVSVLFDSSWFINYNDFFNTDSNATFVGAMGIATQPSCADHSWGFPCCMSVHCMISRQYVSRSVPIMGVVSKYDIYSLFNAVDLQALKQNKSIDIVEILSQFHTFGGEISYSFSMLNSAPLVSYVLTTCLQHVYLTASDLWKTLYQNETVHVFRRIRFSHVVSPTTWRQVAIDGQSVRDHVVEWNQRVLNKSSAVTKRVADRCLHAQCNSACPQAIFFQPSYHDFMTWQPMLLVCIVILTILFAYAVKLVWILQHRRLKKTQARFLNNNNGDVEEATDGRTEKMCLPACPPHSCIGISCSKLTYEVTGAMNNDTLSRRRGPTMLRKPSFSRLRRRSVFAHPERKIIKGVSAYFNPGQLVAIMGPSGSGKTTLLDVLTARKNFKEAERHIFINGLPAEETREWFIKNSGYVLQLATPYHEQLTVRQNLTYSAMMRLPAKMTLKEKMWRVEQVLGQTGLHNVADVVVGDNSSKGSGLSGGQKRRLCVGLQLVDLPSVIFLDEPTSGLDSASSLELLETLHGLTLSGRLVVVTIHQPRIEIFHMFDTILFLCDGQLAYFGSPLMAPQMIAEALQGSGKVADSSNPADTIMDVLTNTELQNIIVDYYEESGEIDSIGRAISRAQRHPQKTLSMKFQKQTSSIANRLLALDGRSSSSQSTAQRFYFPLVFLLFSLALGTCYFQTEKGVLLMSCYMVFLCASQLFMSSVIHAHLGKAFALFALEKADGIAYSLELVMHAFIRIFAQASVSLMGACLVIFLCAVREYDMGKFLLTTLIHLQLNQVWVALIICIACIAPHYAHLVTPMASAVAGFAGGFLVPEPQMPDVYYWLFYINPTHWAYRGTMSVLVGDMQFGCNYDSTLECQQSAGSVVLESFGLHDSDPVISILVLFSMLVFFLVLSVVVLEITHSKKRWRNLILNYLNSIKMSVSRGCSSLYASLNEKKRIRKQQEMARLKKLSENKYIYRGGTTILHDPTETVTKQQANKHVALSEKPLPPLPSQRKRGDTVTGDEGLDDSDSSNEEDHYDAFVVKPNSNNGSFTSFIKNKIKVHEDENNGGSDSRFPKVKFRKKKRTAKLKKGSFLDRRKTFAGVSSDDKDSRELKEMRPKSDEKKRPKSMFHRYVDEASDESIVALNARKLHNSAGDVNARQEVVKKDSVNSWKMSKMNKRTSGDFNKTLHQISHGTLLDNVAKRKSKPPDLVLDLGESAHHGEELRKKPKRHKRSEPKANKDTWSKYLDTASRRHEVYCALSSVKRRIRSGKRNKGEEVRDSLKEDILQKPLTVNLQRKTSMLILNEKKLSMRSQLNGMKHQISNDGTVSPVSERRRQLSRTRNKFRYFDEPENNNEKRETKELIERLSLLSSVRSSDCSALRDSKIDTAINDNNDEDHIYDTVYEDLDKYMPDIKNYSKRPFSEYSGERYRENDPLLPSERALVESLLNKYSHLDRNSSYHPPAKLTFSSGMKIKGSSPSCPSSEMSTTKSSVRVSANITPVDEETPTDEDITNNNTIVANDNNRTLTRDNVNSRTTYASDNSSSARKSSEQLDSDSVTLGSSKGRSRTSSQDTLVDLPMQESARAAAQRKISITVKSVARMESPPEQRAAIVPQLSVYEMSSEEEDIDKKERERQFKKDNYLKNQKQKKIKKVPLSELQKENAMSSSSSSSSEYEESLLKTDEGFIIPDDTISKVIATVPTTKLSRRRGSQQTEIERVFKRENYLKDRYSKRGIRMPTGSTGKVTQLLSKFENNKPTNTNLASGKKTLSLEKLNMKATGRQRKFIKVLKSSKSSYNSTSEGEQASEAENDQLLLQKRLGSFSGSSTYLFDERQIFARRLRRKLSQVREARYESAYDVKCASDYNSSTEGESTDTDRERREKINKYELRISRLSSDEYII